MKGRSSRGGALEAQRARAGETRAALLAAGRALFAEAGYLATGTNDVVARAAVTRGALYHHFADKQELFEAVFRQVSAELNQAARGAVAGLGGDTWAQLVEAFRAYLMLVAASGETQRILLIDGPAVLGWKRWRELQAEWVASGTADTLRLLMAQGLVAEGPAEPLADLIQAALNDAALSIAYAADPEAASSEITEALLRLVGGLRIAPPAGGART